MKVFLSNGTVAILVESLGPNSSASSWVPASLNVGGFLSPSSTMQLIVDVGDPGPIFNIVEGALDAFEVVESTGLADAGTVQYEAWPNPFADQLFIDLGETLPAGTLLEVFDAQGKLVERRSLNNKTRFTAIGQNWNPGVYILKPISQSGAYSPKRVVKH
jgi:hypothetical protein